MSLLERGTGTGRIPTAHAAAWIALAATGLGVWLWTLTGNAPQAWRSLLVSFLFFTSLAAGLVTWSPIVLLSHAKWAGPLERLTAAGTSFAIPSLMALALLWIGGPAWGPWYGKPLHQGAWLSPNLLFGRDLFLLALFWVLARFYVERRRLGHGKIIGAWLVIAYCCVFSILGFDLVMGLDPEWYSALFGGYFFISGLYIAVCAWAFLAVLVEGNDRDRLHDLGKLILAFSILTTYMLYSQLLPIWYENLPQEIRFVVPRVNFRPWSTVSWALLAIVWMGPLVMLLTIRAKRTPWLLGPIALLLLLGLWVERWWLVAPTFQNRLDFGLTEISMFACLFGLLGFGVSWQAWRGLPVFPQGGDEP
jgi:hypothetical protein